MALAPSSLLFMGMNTNDFGDAITVPCGWCGRNLIRRPADVHPDSHGICATCAAEWAGSVAEAWGTVGGPLAPEVVVTCPVHGRVTVCEGDETYRHLADVVRTQRVGGYSLAGAHCPVCDAEISTRAITMQAAPVDPRRI